MSLMENEEKPKGPNWKELHPAYKEHLRTHRKKLKDAERYASGEFTEYPPPKEPEDY